MAYASLVVLAEKLEQILRHNHDCIRHSGREHMESLCANVISLQKFMEDFAGSTDSMIKQLESRITDFGNELRDIIEWGVYDMKFRKAFKRCIKEVSLVMKDATEIRKMLEMKKTVLGRESWIASSTSEFAASSGRDSTVRLNRDMIQIKERIVGHISALQIIPIVGMGGIGKTTLAKYVYVDPQIMGHFDVRGWVTVSQEYNTKKILKEILGVRNDASLTKDNDDGDDVGSLIVDVHKKLAGRRFLIVMDDIWNVEAWENAMNAFTDGNKGSRIIVTTRLLEVAIKISSSAPIHQMQLMDEGQSWELFQNEVKGQQRFPLRLENIGRVISRNCKGLPLAIVVIARLLKLNHTQEYWEMFAKNMNEAMEEAGRGDQLMEILSLSYDNLPHHLRACFLYTSLFPEDYEIPSKKLVWLWVAEGFLKQTRGKSLEEVGEECLVDLVERNLISVGKKRSNGGIKTCTVHDILRSLSLKKAKEEKFSQQIMTHNSGKFSQKYIPWFKDKINSTIVHPRRIGAPSSILTSDNVNYGYVYSLISQYDVFRDNLPPTFRFNLLRVLDVLESSSSSMLNFSLFNLRYFAFTHDSISFFSENISMFQNLETLIVYLSHESMFIPIRAMPKLKHIVVTHGPMSGFCMIDYNNLDSRNSISQTSPLQTLTGFTDFEFTTDAIEILANLLKLKIHYPDTLDPIDYWGKFGFENLVSLHKLRELTLIFENNNYTDSKLRSLPINITFPNKIKKISFTGFTISWEYMSVLGLLPNLQVLKLVACWFESGEWEPIDGEFQQLKYLKLEIENLEHWSVESFHFPRLEQIIICECRKLKEVPSEVGTINTLLKLVIQDCQDSVGNSAREIQKEQEDYGNIQLQVFVENRKENWLEEAWDASFRQRDLVSLPCEF